MNKNHIFLIAVLVIGIILVSGCASSKDGARNANEPSGEPDSSIQMRNCTLSNGEPGIQACMDTDSDENCLAWATCQPLELDTEGLIRNCTVNNCPGIQMCTFTDAGGNCQSWTGCNKHDPLCTGECSNYGQVTDCIIDTCPGKQTCLAGSWGECVKNDPTCTGPAPCIEETRACTTEGCAGTQKCISAGVWDKCVSTDPSCGAEQLISECSYLTKSLIFTNGTIKLTKDLTFTGREICLQLYQFSEDLDVTLDCDGHSITYFGDYKGGSFSDRPIAVKLHGGTVKNCKIKNSPTGIDTIGDRTGIIENNDISGAVYGILVGTVEKISNNHLFDNDVAIELYGENSYANVISGNTIEQNREGIYVSMVSGVKSISGNRIVNNREIGVHLGSSSVLNGFANNYVCYSQGAGDVAIETNYQNTDMWGDAGGNRCGKVACERLGGWSDCDIKLVTCGAC